MSTKKWNHNAAVVPVTAVGIAGHITAQGIWPTINVTLSFGSACPKQLQQAVEGARRNAGSAALNVDFC